MKTGFYKKYSMSLCVLLSAGFLAAVSGCSALPSDGPMKNTVIGASEINETNMTKINLVDITPQTALSAANTIKKDSFFSTFGSISAKHYTVGVGDSIEVSVWEASPGTLFGGAGTASAIGSHQTVFPEQVVDSNGNIIIPFAGTIQAKGKNITQINEDIQKHLEKKANKPQVITRITKNATSNVTIVGEVSIPTKLPLSNVDEKVLDAIAACGGTKQPVDKTAISLTRDDQTVTMALENIISSKKDNIKLLPGDILTASFQPFSLVFLGATGKNDEVNFEAKGITLSQALGRAGGLVDTRADASGVFIFRINGDKPTIYRADLKNPVTYFAATKFPMKNGDILYVSNSSAAELQKFLSIVTQVMYSVATPVNLGLIK